ncbi:MAG: 2-dehydropantoate 2-reductase [Deltaproteobacteria bacterium]|nr:2-dehydropantoate 2-reductase [Deltaproteobacteria bacterium]
MTERVLVAGCGAVGSVVACLLGEAGLEVDVLGRGEHLGAIGRRVGGGIEVEGIWGRHHSVPNRCFDDPAQAGLGYDCVLVACKSFQTEALVLAIGAERLAATGRAISLQNGLGNFERLAAVFGDERSLAARVIFGGEVTRPGRVRVTVEAEALLIGHPSGRRDAGADHWAAVLDAAGVRCRTTDNVIGALWGKVFYNAALNPLGALLGLRYGRLAEDDQRRRVMDRVIDEAYAVASAEGVSLPWRSAAEYRAHFYGNLLPPTVEHRSSMLQDLERGRPTEIDAICGEVVRRGDAHGIDVSANRVLLALVSARSGPA